MQFYPEYDFRIVINDRRLFMSLATDGHVGLPVKLRGQSSQSGRRALSFFEIDLPEVDVEVSAEDGDPFQSGNGFADGKRKFQPLAATVLTKYRNVRIPEIVISASRLGARNNLTRFKLKIMIFKMID